jgi:hypothetical protein
MALKTFKQLREHVQSITEGERGLWDNIHAKRKRIKSGSGERMRKPGSKGAPSKQDFKDSMSEDVEELFDIILVVALKFKALPPRSALRIKSGGKLVVIAI